MNPTKKGVVKKGGGSDRHPDGNYGKTGPAAPVKGTGTVPSDPFKKGKKSRIPDKDSY